MYVCPHCASSADLTSFADGRETCPDCGAPVRHDAERPWVDVARVNNLAEAGFLTDELVGRGIDARIYQLDEFSALSDRWATVYLIRVPARVAREAAAYIREYLAEEAAAERELEPASFQFAQDQSIDPLLWRPVALIILAGVSSFVLGQRFSGQNDARIERRPPRDSLASAIDAVGRPFVTEPAPDQPRHRLSFDRRRETWFLDTDRDRDGRYDARRAFHASGANW